MHINETYFLDMHLGLLICFPTLTELQSNELLVACFSTRTKDEKLFNVRNAYTNVLNSFLTFSLS
jgi:hypothetical protein